LSVSFNGNRYAIQSADVACLSPNALILAVLARVFADGGADSVRALASEWGADKIKRALEPDLSGFSADDVSLCLIEDSDMEELVSRSESFRKTVRGEHIGRLG